MTNIEAIQQAASNLSGFNIRLRGMKDANFENDGVRYLVVGH